MSPNEPLSIDPNDYCFIDTETRSSVDVTVAGPYAHTAAPDFCVLIVTYAIGLGPEQRWTIRPDVTVIGPDSRLDWRNAPADLAAFVAKARAGKGWFVAWNAAFDRLALNRGVSGGPAGECFLPVEAFLDAMVQAVRSHYPPDLAGASRLAACPIPKRASGKKLIGLFSRADGGTPAEHPAEWAEFVAYAADDIAAMRSIWLGTLPLPACEWQEYWISERINDRGLPIDRAFCRSASLLAELNAARANADVARITGGAITSVHQHAAILRWVMARLEHLPRVEAILTREITLEPDETGMDVAVVELGLDKGRVESLITYLLQLDAEQGLTDDEADALELLEVRQYGASATPRKFTKLLPMLEADDRLRGQYVFNGAATTGRYSSRGLQVHNLVRATVGDADAELRAIELVGSATPENVTEVYERLKAAFGPVGRTLSRLIRPAILAPEGQTLVWADWSAIEAIGLPWLANSTGARKVLDVIRASQQDKSKPDIYQTQAGLILRKSPLEVTKIERQSHGKVPVLSLGYGGGVGALMAMAENYGVSFDEALAKTVVRDYRAANPWMTAFWDQLWEAAQAARAAPGTEFTAGRVSYVFDDTYMNGTLICVLPCGRALLYPKVKWERSNQKNRKTGEVREVVRLTYARGYGRAPLWAGLLAENVTQATCASLLRWVLREYETRWPGYVTFHTHDEVGLVVPAHKADEFGHNLMQVMQTPPTWAEGMPLAVSITRNDWYTKAVD
jgi:DNA polymerase